MPACCIGTELSCLNFLLPNMIIGDSNTSRLSPPCPQLLPSTDGKLLFDNWLTAI